MAGRGKKRDKGRVEQNGVCKRKQPREEIDLPRDGSPKQKQPFTAEAAF